MPRNVTARSGRAVFDTGCNMTMRSLDHAGANLQVIDHIDRIHGFNGIRNIAHRPLQLLNDGTARTQAADENTLFSADHCCRVVGRAFAWAPSCTSPHLGDLTKSQAQRIRHELDQCASIHQMVTINGLPYLHRASARNLSPDDIVQTKKVLDTGASHDCIFAYPDMQLKGSINVRGVNGHRDTRQQTVVDEIIVDEGPELISVGRACVKRGYGFFWLPGDNCPWFGRVDNATAERLRTILTDHDGLHRMEVENYIPYVDTANIHLLLRDVAQVYRVTLYDAEIRASTSQPSWELDEHVSHRRCLDLLQSATFRNPCAADPKFLNKIFFDFDQSAMATFYTTNVEPTGGFHNFEHTLAGIVYDLNELVIRQDAKLQHWKRRKEYVNERILLRFVRSSDAHRAAFLDKLRQIAEISNDNVATSTAVYSIRALPADLKQWVVTFAPDSFHTATHVVLTSNASTLADGKGVYVSNPQRQPCTPRRVIDSSGLIRTTYVVDPDSDAPIDVVQDTVPFSNPAADTRRLAQDGANTITILSANVGKTKPSGAHKHIVSAMDQVPPQLSYDVVICLRHKSVGQSTSGYLTVQDLAIALPQWASHLRNPAVFHRLERLSRGRLQVNESGDAIRARYGHSSHVIIDDALLHRPVSPDADDFPELLVHHTTKENADKIRIEGITREHTDRSHIFLRSAGSAQGLLTDMLHNADGPRSIFVVRTRDLLAASIAVLAPQGTNPRGLFLTTADIPPNLLLHGVNAEMAITRLSQIHNTMVETALPGEATSQLPLYEACDQAAEILTARARTTTAQVNVMTRARYRAEEAKADNATTAPTCPPCDDGPAQPGDVSTPLPYDDPCPTVPHDLQVGSAIDTAVNEAAQNVDDPHRFHFPTSKSCEVCQTANMRRRHTPTPDTKIRIGCWAIDVAHGAGDGSVVLVFANASTNAEAVQTLHVVIPENLETAGIQSALLQGLLELEYFYAIDSVRRIHADKAASFEAQRSMLRQRHFVTLTTTQGGDSAANGTAERGIRTLKNMSEASLANSGFDHSSWPQSMRHSAFLYSRAKRVQDRFIQDTTNRFWMRREIFHMLPFGAEILAGKGSKVGPRHGAQGRRAVYFYPSTDVSPGHRVGIVLPVAPDGTESLSKVAALRHRGGYHLRFFDDVSQMKPRLDGKRFIFPSVTTDPTQLPHHIDDLNSLWIQCRHEKCGRYRCADRRDIKELQASPGFECSRLQDTKCTDSVEPSFAKTLLPKVGHSVDASPDPTPPPRRGRPTGPAKPKQPPRQQHIEELAGKKVGAPRKQHRATPKRTVTRAAAPNNTMGRRGRAVAAGMLACATHFMHDAEGITHFLHDAEPPPAAVLQAYHAAFPTATAHPALTVDPTATNAKVDAWTITDATGRTVSTDATALVYRELGIAAAPSTPGGPAAVTKELNKYLGTRSLGRPVARSSLHRTAIVYRAKMLFGQKAVETDDPQAKARLVVGGHIGFTPSGHVAVKHKRSAEHKIEGDYWTPGASLAAVRYLCSHAAVHNHALSSRDLSQAYLQTTTTEKQSYIEMPLNDEMLAYFPETVRADIQTLRDAGHADKDILFPVIASLYGLPSAGYSYWRALQDHLLRCGWRCLDSDGGALWARDGCLLCVYVDDLLLSAPEHDHGHVWRQHILADRWKAEEEAILEITRYLGLYLHRRKRGGYLVEQHEYGKSVVRTYTAMTGRKITPRTTMPQRTSAAPDMPSTMPADDLMHVPDDPSLPVGHETFLNELQQLGDSPAITTGYRDHAIAARAVAEAAATVNAAKVAGKSKVDPVHSTVGALMYLSRGSRPDLCWGVQRAAESIHAWTTAERDFLEHLLGYILTQDRALVYDPLPKGTLVGDIRPVGYTDSNYIAPSSRSGILYTLQSVNGLTENGTAWTHLLDWTSRKQRYASLSSAQAETVALNAGTRLAQDSTATVTAAFPEIKNTPFIFCDSAPALAAVRRGWSRSLSTSSRAVGCAVQWLHDLACADSVRFRWLDGKLNPADSLTKPLGKQKCQLIPMMATRNADATWTTPTPRAEGALYVPISTQPTWHHNSAKCFSCDEQRALCHRCKTCALCGCECQPDTAPHPLDKPSATNTTSEPTTTAAPALRSDDHVKQVPDLPTCEHVSTNTTDARDAPTSAHTLLSFGGF